jgi:CRP/FNR family cyclic AMP-dependent transcriptional regulator
MNRVSGLFANAACEVKGPGTILFEEGTPGTTMYIVRTGEVAVQIGGRAVEQVGAGGIVGEMALIDNSTRSATAVTLTECEIVPVDQRRFLFLIQETPFFALEVMQVMANRLRAMNRLGAKPTPLP